MFGIFRSKPQRQSLSDKQIAEFVIQTLQAQLDQPEILRDLREGLIEGLNGINEVVAYHGGRIVANVGRRQAPQNRGRNYR